MIYQPIMHQTRDKHTFFFANKNKSYSFFLKISRKMVRNVKKFILFDSGKWTVDSGQWRVESGEKLYEKRETLNTKR